MQTFRSSISGNFYPVAQKISGKAVRQCIKDEIIKEHPDFNETSLLSTEELNHYRNLYIQNTLAKELGTLTDLEKQVVATMQNNRLITDKLHAGKKEKLTRGQKLADTVANFGGSWKFITIFCSFLICWMIINVMILSTKAFDPYPFILLNLILSCIAALQAPVIMMSQNRQEEKDRERAKNDYMINLKSEMEIRLLHEKIDHLIVNQQEKLMEIQQIQVDMMNDIIDRLDRKKVL
ncbi:MAG TPA: DUF1003 domain-containing protein [Chitinophagaceae bacterium]|jgi:uncharacterized membrane protein